MKLSDRQLDDFIGGYIACAIWADLRDDECEPPEGYYDISDLSPESSATATAVCIDFVDANEDLLIEASDKFSWSCLGQDFWLTRNSHGSGYWDRGLKETGEELTKAAKIYNGASVYLGDDGKVHIE